MKRKQAPVVTLSGTRLSLAIVTLVTPQSLNTFSGIERYLPVVRTLRSSTVLLYSFSRRLCLGANSISSGQMDDFYNSVHSPSRPQVSLTKRRPQASFLYDPLMVNSMSSAFQLILAFFPVKHNVPYLILLWRDWHATLS